MGLAARSLLTGKVQAEVLFDLILTVNIRTFPHKTKELEFIFKSLAVSISLPTVTAAHGYQIEISTRTVSSPFPARAFQTNALRAKSTSASFLMVTLLPFLCESSHSTRSHCQPPVSKGLPYRRWTFLQTGWRSTVMQIHQSTEEFLTGAGGNHTGNERRLCTPHFCGSWQITATKCTQCTKDVVAWYKTVTYVNLLMGAKVYTSRASFCSCWFFFKAK